MGEKLAEIYALCDPDTGEIRYIGKANNSKRRLASHIRDSRRKNMPVHGWIRKLVDSGKMPELIVIELTYDWCEAERRLIAKSRARGDRLLNVADGGNEPHCPRDVRVANATLVNDDRASNPFKFTRHKILRQLGVMASHMRRLGNNDTASRVDESACKLRKMDPEVLFWRIFLQPKMHWMLPEYAKRDAKEYCALHAEGLA